MKATISLLALAAMITVNVLANTLPINGKTQSDIANQFQVFFTPAGYVFSIWGLIYASLICFVGFHLLPRNRTDPAIDRISAPFWISCLANISWLFLWHYEYFALTMVAMLVLLGSLIRIEHLTRMSSEAAGFRWFVKAPFRLYLGWITVATIANLTVVLDFYDSRPFQLSAESWAVGMVVTAGLITLGVGIFRRDLIFLGVVLWALIGIGVARAWAGPVAIAAVACSVAIVLVYGYVLLRSADGAPG